MNYFEIHIFPQNQLCLYSLKDYIDFDGKSWFERMNEWMS